MRYIVTALLMLCPSLAVARQSFDCAKARAPVEQLVCADAGLRELDEYMGRYYAAGRQTLGEARLCLQSNQIMWLETTRDLCKDAACLRTAYLGRLAELDPLQPGATAIRTVELPAVPAMVWVIPPAADKTAAPLNRRAKPFEATGIIVDDVAGGDGFMLRTTDGAKLPLSLLMFLEAPTTGMLTILSKEKGTTFRARGYAAMDGKRTYFEPSRCTFIHRLPHR